MHPMTAWMIGAAYISYRYGYKCKMLPLPKRYIALTGFISLASLVSMANENVGALFAYGSLLGMIIYGYAHPSDADTNCDKITPKSIGSDQQSQSGNKPNQGVPNPPHTMPWA